MFRVQLAGVYPYLWVNLPMKRVQLAGVQHYLSVNFPLYRVHSAEVYHLGLSVNLPLYTGNIAGVLIYNSGSVLEYEMQISKSVSILKSVTATHRSLI